MIISSNPPAYLAAQTRSTQRTGQSQQTGQSDGAPAATSSGTSAGALVDTPVPAQNTGYTTPSGAPVSGASPLGGFHILSRIQTTLPNGLTLAMVRFDHGTGGLDASSADASPPNPTPEDQRQDEAMLKAFMQMAHSFNDNPSASDIQLEGTAAVDLDLKADLKA